MNDQTVTIGRFLWEYSIALALILCGFLLAGAFAELIAPESQFVYGLCLCPSLVPLMLWLRHCGVAEFNNWDLSGFVLVLIVTIVVREFAPVRLKDNPLFLAATTTLVFWFIVRIRRCWKDYRQSIHA